MLRTLSIVPALALAAAATTACTMERDYLDPTQAYDDSYVDNGEPWADEDYGDYYGTPLPAVNGRVNGDIGAVRGFDAPVDVVSASWEPSYRSTNVTLTAYDIQGRMGMLIVDMSGIDLATAPAGSYHFTTQNVDPGLGDEGAYVAVTGCSEDPDSYYDAPGNEGDIVIQDTAEGRQITVDTVLPDESYESTTTAHGSFTLTP